ncbi:MAG: hypothetical protein UT02_C0041G0010 [Parcubacteria group bacterium GW2011_GWC2_38_7]|nr:MAG: hypothetical protein UT02_C0041G0010 [Parcubacteria group bacterium GW2011_GWC2_38_7]
MFCQDLRHKFNIETKPQSINSFLLIFYIRLLVCYCLIDRHYRNNDTRLALQYVRITHSIKTIRY